MYLLRAIIDCNSCSMYVCMESTELIPSFTIHQQRCTTWLIPWTGGWLKLFTGIIANKFLLSNRRSPKNTQVSKYRYYQRKQLHNSIPIAAEGNPDLPLRSSISRKFAEWACACDDCWFCFFHRCCFCNMSMLLLFILLWILEILMTILYIANCTNGRTFMAGYISY